MTTSELIQETMSNEIRETYYAVRRVALHPPQDLNEFVETILRAIRNHPEQLAELAGRWHRRVVKMKRESQLQAEWEDWFREKGGRTEVSIQMAISNYVDRHGDGYVSIWTHDPGTAALIVKEHGGTHYPEHACWLLPQGVNLDLWIPHIDDMLATMSEPTYSVVSGPFESAYEEHASGLRLSEALTTASRVFDSYQERRIKEGLPRLKGQFTSLDNCDYVYGLKDGWCWLCDESEIVIRGDDEWFSDTVDIVRDDPSKAVA